MKISDMFPSEYMRGVDVAEPRKMKIIKVTQEMVKNRETNQMEPENILFFEGEAKKMRLNITTTKEIHFEIFGLSPADEPSDTWPGKYVTVEWAKTKTFGKTQIVPKVRKPKSSDKVFPAAGKEKALNTLTRNEFWARVKRDLALPVGVSKFVLIQAELDGDYKQENAPKMWKVLEKDGQKLDQFLEMILTDTPFYRSKDEVLAVMNELDTGYEFSENFEAELSLVLDKHAKDAANDADAQDDESGNKEDEPSLDDIFSDASTEKIQEDELPF